MATTAYGWDSFYSTTLAGAITDSDTTIPVVVAPTAQEGTLVIESDSSTNREIIYYTSVSGTNLVLPSVGAGRGQEGTTAVAHSSGVSIKKNTTSRDFEVLQDGTGMADSSITPRKLLAGTGTSWVWQDWTPTWTNLTIGNATVVAKYIQIGKTVHFKLSVTLGSSSSVGTAPLFSLPVNAATDINAFPAPIGIGVLVDTGTANYLGLIHHGGTNRGRFSVGNAAGTYLAENAPTATVPFTWTTSDVLHAIGTYEAA